MLKWMDIRSYNDSLNLNNIFLVRIQNNSFMLLFSLEKAFCGNGKYIKDKCMFLSSFMNQRIEMQLESKFKKKKKTDQEFLSQDHTTFRGCYDPSVPFRSLLV